MIWIEDIVGDVLRGVTLRYPSPEALDRDRAAVALGARVPVSEALRAAHRGVPGEDRLLLARLERRGRVVSVSTRGAVLRTPDGSVAFQAGPVVVESAGNELALVPFVPGRYTGAWALPGTVYPWGVR